MSEPQRTEDMRQVTLGLRRNLGQIRWSWEHPPRAYDYVSVPVQLVMSLLTYVALTPLEEMLTDLEDDPMLPPHRRAFEVPDLDPDNLNGFAGNLAQWRAAIGSGSIEMVMTPDSRRLLAGLRAWTPHGEEGAAWEMTLDIERLSAIVYGLAGALSYWGLPVVPLVRDFWARGESGGTKRTRKQKD